MNLRKLLNIEYSVSTRSILQWLWRTSRGIRAKAVLNTALKVLAVGVDFLFIWTTKWAVDIATGKNDSSLSGAVFLLLAVLLVQVLISFSGNWTNALLGVKSNNIMQLRTFSRILNSAWNGTEKHHSGDTMNRLITDSNNVVSVISDTFPSVLSVLVRLVGGFVFVYMMSPTVALVLICVVPVFMLIGKLYMGKMRSMNREVRDTESRIQSILQESIQNRVVIKTLEQCSGMISKLAGTQTDLREKVVRKTVFSSVSNLIISLGFMSGYFITFVWCVRHLQSGAITYGMMLAFIQLVGQIQGPFRSLASYVPTIVGAFTSAERLMELEELPLEESGSPLMLEGSVGIRAEHLSFKYEDGDADVMSDLSFDFKPGTTTAIIGETGRGKTTLIRLVLALLTPTKGSLELYSGSSGRKESVSPRTRCNIVYVPQGNTLLSGTIRANLLLGNPDATQAQLEEVLRLACADFVQEKEEGLEFMCGEDGSGLSEGQAQRIAIARSLLRPGNIVILDESTSALDNDTEQRLISNLTDFSRESRKTVLVVTHRMSFLKSCTDVLDMDKLNG